MYLKMLLCNSFEMHNTYSDIDLKIKKFQQRQIHILYESEIAYEFEGLSFF